MTKTASSKRGYGWLSTLIALIVVMAQLVGFVRVGPAPVVQAHNLQTRMVYMFFDPATQACLDARLAGTTLPAGCAPLPPGWAPGDPVLQANDKVGVIIKVVPRDGTTTGVGGHIDFYVPNGVEVVDVGYVVPDGAGGFSKVAMKGQSPIAIGDGPIGAKSTSQLIGFTDVFNSTASGLSSTAVNPASGLHLGTIAGVYGDTGIFYSTDPDTSYGSWQRFTNDSTANGCGSLAFNPTALGKTLVNNSGDTVIPCNKWDAEQLMAWGVKGGTFGVSAPIVDYGDGRGNAPWGFAAGTGGPQSGYAWNFDWDEWQASAKDAAAMKAAMGTDEIGPWNRIQYPGSRVSYDQAGLVSTVLGYASIDASHLGVPVSSLPETDALTGQTDTTSPKAIRWAVGQLTAYRPEYAWVQVRVTNATAGILNASGCPDLRGDTFGGDAGGTDNGKDHLWRYYEPTEVKLNMCLAPGKPASEEFAKVGDIYQFPIKVYNLQDFPLTNVVVKDTLGAGLSLISAVPAQNSGPNPLVWNVGTLLPGQKFQALVTVKVTASGYIDNCMVVSSNELPPQSACDTTIVGPYPYLIPSKTVRSASVAPGNTVIYDVLVRNIGEGPTGNPVTIREFLPTGFTYDPSYAPVVYVNGALITLLPSQINYSDASNPVFTVPAAIQGGKQLTLAFRAKVSAAAEPGEYCNTYSVTQNGVPITSGSEGCVTVAGGKIGDFIWRDWDGDGMQDAGEEGIANVKVFFDADNDGVLDWTDSNSNGQWDSGEGEQWVKTDSNGLYYFTGLTAGAYPVTVDESTLPAGHTQTGDPDEAGTCVTCDAKDSGVTLTENQQYLTADFGYKPTGTASIGDKVFEDTGNDGVFDSGTDTGIANVTVWLYEDSNNDGVIDAGDALVATTTSNGSGDYLFSNLATGYSYLVKVDKNDADIQTYFNTKYDPDPVPYQLSTAEVSSSPSLSGADLDNDFGFWRVVPASIGDQLFIDGDGDNTYDMGETPVAGVTVTLYRDGVPLRTTVSGPDGTYLFDNLGPGDYTVKVDTADPDIPGGHFATVTEFTKLLAAGEHYLTADFPFVPLISKTVSEQGNDGYATTGDTLTFGVSVNYPGADRLENVRVIDPLPAGVTYVSGSVSAGGTYGTYSPLAGVPGDGAVTTSGIAAYGTNGNTPDYRLWDGDTFDPTGTPMVTTGQPNILTGAAAPTRDEKLVVAIVAADPDVRALYWNGTTWAALPSPPALAGGGLANVNNAARVYWSGAVAYEQSSGDAILVWNNGTTASAGLTYNVWNGSSWGSNSTISTPVAGEPYHMRLAAKPGADEMVLVVSNSSGYDYALVWNGSSWGNSVTLDGTSGGSLTSVHVAYEQQSGRAMVVYGKNADKNLYYRIWNGSSWTSEGTLNPGAAATNAPLWVSIGADPTSNRIAVGVVSTGSTWLAVWDGSAWGDIQQATATPLITTALNVGVAFETFSGDLLAVYGKSGGGTTVYYRTKTSSGVWSSEATGADVGGVPNVIVLSRSPNSDRVMMTTNDGGSDANYTVWNGSAWETPFEATANTGLSTGQPALFLWDQNLDPASLNTVTASPTAVAVGGSVAVQVTLRASKTINNVTPSLAIVGGGGSCTTADAIPANVLAGVSKTFSFTCTPTSLGEIYFLASAAGAGGYTFSVGQSNTVLVSASGTSNVVTWNLGTSTDPVGGTTASKKFIYAFRGAGTQSFWAYNPATNVWPGNPTDPADTPSGVTIKEGGALANDGLRYVYALRGNNSRVFLRYDAQADTWDDVNIADLPLTTDKTVLKGGALVYLNGYVYAFIGQDSVQFWRYSVSGNSWTRMADALGTVNNGAGLTTDGTYIYGTQGDGKKGFWRYDVATDTWLARAPTLDNFGDGGCVVYAGGAIYALRGGGQKNFYRYNIAANTWTRLASTAGNIDDGGAIVYDGQYIYALQGKTTTFYRYDLTAGTWSTMTAAPAAVGWGGALSYLASGNVTHSAMSVAPALVTDGPGDQQVKVRLTLTSQGAINNIVAGTISATGTNGAAAACGATSWTLASADANLDGTLTDAVIFERICNVTAGTVPGSITFSANASSISPATTFATATSNSVLVTPPLTWQATVNAGAPAIIQNTAILDEAGGTVDNVPSNTTKTATTGSIGDYVWNDLDGDGMQDGNEYGLVGVRVYVDSNNNGVWDAGEPYDITNGSGGYRIPSLGAGTYTVRIDTGTLPAGYVPTTAISLSVTLSAGQQYNDADFGARAPGQGSIGDYIWRDADNDGVQDAGEAGLPGITVKLYKDANNDGVLNAGDYVIYTTTTNANGLYTFGGLYAGNYIVQVDETSLVTSPYGGSYQLGASMDPTTGTVNPRAVNLPTDTTAVTNADFGYNWTGSIGDYVWWDADGDGVQDGGESPISGAVVLLYTDVNGDGILDPFTDTQVGIAFTDASGNYLFSNLPPGNYLVDVYEDSITTDGNRNIVPTTANVLPVSLDPDEDYLAADFGYYRGALVQGNVFWDEDRNGIFDADEQGIYDPGPPEGTVTVHLVGTDMFGNLVDKTVETDASGHFSFVVPEGDYTLIYVPQDVEAIDHTLTDATTPTSYTFHAYPGENWYEQTSFDFGVDNSGKIGDFVWMDLDGVGDQDAGEPGIGGVTVQLIKDTNNDNLWDLDGADNILGTADDEPILESQATNANGYYQFVGLPDGNYLVRVDPATVPAGYSQTYDNSGSQTDNLGQGDISGGNTINTVDFGYQPVSNVYTVTGNVWRDNNGDGERGGNAINLPNIRVCLYVDSNGNGLYDPNEPPFACTTTDANGNYSFPGVPNGKYVVMVDTTTLPNTAYTQSSESTPSDPWNPCGPLICDSQSDVIVSGANPPVENFGYYESYAKINGSICEGNGNGDCNRAGDPSEPGLAGVPVFLTSAGPDGILGTADDVTQVKFTDENGDYMFKDLLPGPYQIVKSTPTGYVSLADIDGGNPNYIYLNLAAGEHRPNQDFEVKRTGAIGDTVWLDVDGDGVQDVGEPGLANVVVELKDGAGNPIDSDPYTAGVQPTYATTDQYGNYLFTDAPAGTYTVDVISGIPAGLVASPGTSDPSAPFALLPGETKLDVDFGYTGPAGSAVIGDYVWSDANNDGIQDPGEPGIGGVTVHLKTAGPDGILGTGDDATAATTTTGPDGRYYFTGVTPGDYVVDVVAPAGYTLTSGPQSSSDPTKPITVGAADVYLDADFGFYKADLHSISDTVWYDADLDGMLDAGEAGIADVSVGLVIDSNNNGVWDAGEPIIATDITDLNGDFSFNGLPNGNYVVVVLDSGGKLTDLQTTTPEATAGQMSVVVSGADVTGENFGYAGLGPIGDTIFSDHDGDGFQDPGEAGIPGVQVRLYYDSNNNGVFDAGTDTLIATKTTDATGYYAFYDLPSGTFFVSVSSTQAALSGYTATTTDQEPANQSGSTSSVEIGAMLSTSALKVTVIGGELDLSGEGIIGGTDDGLAHGVMVMDGRLDLNGDGSVTATDDGWWNGVRVIDGRLDLNGDGSITAADAGSVTIRQVAFMDADFGYRNTALADVSGSVWNDLDADGYDDGAGEPPIPGVTVALVDNQGNVVATTTTDANGDYIFWDVPPGNYSVTVTDQNNVLQGYTLTSGLDSIPVVVGSTNVTDVDFGYVRNLATGAIGDYVWLDADRDGYQDGAEGGIPGVTLDLYRDTNGNGALDGGDVKVATTTTDANGYYLFDGLVAGTYLVDVTSLPVAGLAPTTGTSDPSPAINLSAGEYYPDADFGYAPQTGYAIGDTVWYDADSDGVQDPGEVGIGGVKVTVTNGTNTYTAYTTPDGYWLVPGLTGGTWTVSVDTTTLPSGYNTTPTNGAVSRDYVITDKDVLFADFGFNGGTTATIGDYIWLDVDGDGMQDGGESGIAGVTVNLLNNSGDIVATTTTDSNGYYSFIGVPNGSYTVAVSDVNNVLAGLNQSGDPDEDGIPCSTCDSRGSVTISGGASDLTMDFGYAPVGGTIGDQVWHDLNGDGLYGTAVINGLLDLNDDGVANNDDDGWLTGLASAVRVIDGKLDLDGDGSITSADDGTFLGVAVVDGMLDINRSGGAPDGSDDGILFNEPGMQGITLDLWLDVNGNGTIEPGTDNLVRSTTTDENGQYQFRGLPAGKYVVDVTDKAGVLAGFAKTSGAAGSDNNSQSDPYAVTLTSGAPSNYTADFGYKAVTAYSISGVVFADNDNNGLYQMGTDNLVPKIEVFLYRDLNGNGVIDPGDPIIGSTVTGDYGEYQFADLPNGTYLVSVDATGTRLDGFYQTTQTSTPQPGAQPVTLNNASSADNDFGFYAPDPQTVPVTLAYFLATSQGGRTYVEWSTATEVGNVGFNLYAQKGNGLQRLNAELVASKASDALEPQDYGFETEIGGEVFYLEDVDIRAGTRMHGPFKIGEPYGERVQPEPINWDATVEEHEAKEQERIDERSAEVQAQIDAAQPAWEEVNEATPTPEPSATPRPELTASLWLPMIWSGAGNGARTLAPEMQAGAELMGARPPATFAVAELSVNRTGLYRLTYEALLNAGIDLKGAPVGQLALVNQGRSVPIFVSSSGKFGPGAYIEFYGEALDTLYSKTNVYVLRVDQSLASRVSVDGKAPDKKAQAAGHYIETNTVERDLVYHFASPNGDPWMDTRMMVYTKPGEWTFQIDAEGYVSDAAPATLDVGLWGLTDLPSDPDHHVVVLFNNVQVAEMVFDGNTDQPLTVALPAGALKSSGNALTLRLPGDTGATYDIVALDKYSVTYPRAFVAREGRLSFNAKGQVFEVQGLPTPNVLVYRLDAKGLARLSRTDVAGAGTGYRARFAGTNEAATYLVSNVESMLAPAIRPARSVADITSGPAQYLIISHPDFIAGLGPLVDARRAQGLTVKVVDVEDVYAQFSNGIFDPQGIKAYVGYAIEKMGTEYVLLVGGDSYDYQNNLGLGSLSFIPSLYTQTDAIVKFAPVDPLLTDVNGDNVPDRPIGRLPVRTSAELQIVIQKTLAYQNKTYNRTAVFAADAFDAAASLSFTASSNALVARLPSGWSVQKAYLDQLSVTAARSALTAAVNNGTALTSYVGHSGLTAWTFKSLFTTDHAKALTNAGKPTVVTQWGCWNTYYVAPKYNTLGHVFLISGDRGAAAVFGASALTEATSEDKLGRELMPRLVQPGMSLGTSMQQAKAQLGASEPQLIDVLLGWTLLGDPALVIEK